MTVPLILNPAAGGGRCGQRAPEAVQRLRDAGVRVDVHRTEAPGHATELARALHREGHPLVLCAGGDGTTYEVLNGLFPDEGGGPPPAVGMVPLGTGNSFLKDLAILDADTALAAVAAGRRRRVDVVRVEHADGVLHYVNLLSVGFTSEVGATTNRWFKPLGAAGYAVATVLEVARLQARPFPHRLDDGEPDRSPYVFLSFSNSRCTAGDMQMAPYADPSDGRLDVVRVGPLGRLGLLREFPKIYAGRHLEHPLNSSTTAARVDLDLGGPVPVMVDGEVVRLELRRLEVVPGALEVLA